MPADYHNPHIRTDPSRYSFPSSIHACPRFLSRLRELPHLPGQDGHSDISIHIADNVPAELIGDELRITQVLNNLISNAIKFTQKGRIGVEVTKTYNSADEVELFFMVIDTGIGIDEKDVMLLK